ncbi:MAG TPA: hypothetical protein VEA99_20035 [Gemmatimonadaceae bacterium]|nr:hypothetical protein [Gemmatimonadaceae bacterium]
MPDAPDQRAVARATARHLVQLLLPLRDNDGAAIEPRHFREVRDELTTRFGGLTAYTRAPADGLWTDGGEDAARDQIVIYEVMTDRIDPDWWDAFRRALERRFRQETIVIRALPITMM